MATEDVQDKKALAPGRKHVGKSTKQAEGLRDVTDRRKEEMRGGGEGGEGGEEEREKKRECRMLRRYEKRGRREYRYSYICKP
eukprot:759070-Hanusia_phi.AAC.1